MRCTGQPMVQFCAAVLERWPSGGTAPSVPFRIYNGVMATVTLSVKKVPADLAKRLKARAVLHHRSLQGELMAILDEASRQMTVEDLSALVSRVGLRTPAESMSMVRAARDGRRR